VRVLNDAGAMWPRFVVVPTKPSKACAMPQTQELRFRAVRNSWTTSGAEPANRAMPSTRRAP
jgi:hypothetical protein